ncbi:unnamed protein product [Cyprideis torosa]|uniref:Uncharacterized protein n=1 Tax=Cyprideis torosa TaxID=163714 RepID=A0A7R8WPU7_9CRUS|nr:unnamed protein product [Cyprideis torosa]CAG0905359.1 unnamed protein product [Cyprideis torosa]
MAPTLSKIANQNTAILVSKGALLYWLVFTLKNLKRIRSKNDKGGLVLAESSDFFVINTFTSSNRSITRELYFWEFNVPVSHFKIFIFGSFVSFRRPFSQSFNSIFFTFSNHISFIISDAFFFTLCERFIVCFTFFTS